jgi:ureidoacrylate peracid hydrolase
MEGVMAENDRSRAGGTTYKAHGENGRTFDPAKTALLVIDPVNDFLAEEGAAWELTKSTVTKHDVIGHLRQLIDGVRAAGIPVLYGPMAYTSDDYAHHPISVLSGVRGLLPGA